MKKLGFISVVLLSICFTNSTLAADDYSIFINRKAHMLYVLDSSGKQVFEAPCGIGRGGLKRKERMSDSVTPTGEFEVDLILSPSRNKIADDSKNMFLNDKRFASYLSTESGLKKLFSNMNGIDFDGDEKPDNSYGISYIGFSSKSAVTGPKMKMIGDIPYWYSIAIHGTQDVTNIGRSNSGGCIHLGKDALKKLLAGPYLKIGTKVKITDDGPLGRN